MILIPKPLKHWSDHKPTRLPERKRMTIAAGFRCNGGVIFGADTEEWIGEVMKDRVHKIPTLIKDYCRAMITGSCSDGHVMDTTVERIFDVIHDKRPPDYGAMQIALRDVLLKF